MWDPWQKTFIYHQESRIRIVCAVITLKKQMYYFSNIHNNNDDDNDSYTLRKKCNVTITNM